MWIPTDDGTRLNIAHVKLIEPQPDSRGGWDLMAETTDQNRHYVAVDLGTKEAALAFADKILSGHVIPS